MTVTGSMKSLGYMCHTSASHVAASSRNMPALTGGSGCRGRRCTGERGRSEVDRSEPLRDVGKLVIDDHTLAAGLVLLGVGVNAPVLCAGGCGWVGGWMDVQRYRKCSCISTGRGSAGIARASLPMRGQQQNQQQQTAGTITS